MVINRLCAIWIVWATALAVMPSVQAAPIRIGSQVELTRYLRDTPPGTSPLDDLSPGGRKRFIRQLVFGRRGLRSVPVGDPENELTHQQAARLYALFGVDDLAQGVGLNSERYARLQHERLVDAAARRCEPGHCPESDIEQRYDELILQPSDRSLPDAERADRDARRYDRLFNNAQSPTTIMSVSDPDRRLLKRASEFAVFNAPDALHLGQLKAELDEMQRRHMVEDEDYADLYQGLITNRQLSQARVLATQHPDMGVGVAPRLRSQGRLPATWPTALSFGAHGHTMSRQAFDISTPLRIVVVASCHFSQDAAHAVESDPQLRRLFARHGVWLASQAEQFDSAVEWDRHFPDQPIHIAWTNSEWSMLDSWDMPTFYVFRHGQLKGKFSGWHDLPTLKTSLRKAGALH